MPKDAETAGKESEIKSFGDTHEWGRALAVLRSIRKPLASSYEATVVACGQSQQWEPACGLLDEMRDRGMKCEALHSYELVISACGRAGEWERALTVLDSIQHPLLRRREGTFCFNAAIAACKVALRWAKAVELLEVMNRDGPPLTQVSFSTAITACGRAGEAERGLRLLDEMHSAYGVHADAVCYAAAISACCPGGERERVLRLLDECEARVGPPTDPSPFTAAIRELCLAGHLDEAHALLRKVHATPALVRQDIFPMHHALLSAYRRQGLHQSAAVVYSMASSIDQVCASLRARSLLFRSLRARSLRAVRL